MPSLPILLTFACYLIAVIGIGIIASRRTKNLGDYVLGGRTLGGMVTALGAGASDMSGWLLLGLPGAVYVHGLEAIWMPIGLSIGAYLNWRLVAPRLRVYSELAQDALTIPAYLDQRFCDHTGILRGITATVILIFFTFYAASGFVGAALLFQQTFPTLNYEQALLIGAIFLVSYTVIGGFLAVSWVDCLQGMLMLGALLLIPFLVVYHLGWEVTASSLFKAPIFTPSFSWIGVISLLAWGMGYPGQPHILVRFMAIEKVAFLKKARRICTLWMSVCLLGAIATGFLGSIYTKNNPLEDPETVFIFLSQHFLTPWLVGMVLAAVLSAIMSTIAAQLLGASSALAEDFYRRFIKPDASAKSLLWVSRLTVLMVAMISLLLARNPQSNILHLVAYAWAGLGAAFGPVIVASLWWKEMTKITAIIGMITGALMVILWKELAHLGGIFMIYEIIPGCIVSIIAMLIANYFSRHSAPATIDATFSHMETVLKKQLRQ